jgi:hypothetical protein
MERICFSSTPTAEEEQLRKEIGVLTKNISTATDTLLLEEDAELKEIMKSRIQEMRFQKKRMEDSLLKLKSSRENKKETIKNAIDLILRAENVIQNGTEEEKKDVLNGIGLNWRIEQKNVFRDPQFPLEQMKKAKELYLAERPRLNRPEPARIKQKSPLRSL